MGLSRRTFIKAAGTVVGSAVLGSCAMDRARPPSTGGALPIHGDNLPIDAGATLERDATLRIYQWRDYLAGDVLESFARRHAASDVHVEVESFTTMAEAAERLRRSGCRLRRVLPHDRRDAADGGRAPGPSPHARVAPQPEEPLALLPDGWWPVLRRRAALQRPVHRLLDGDRVAARSGSARRRARVSIEPLRRLLERALSRRGGHLRRLPRGGGDGLAPPWGGPEHRRGACDRASGGRSRRVGGVGGRRGLGRGRLPRAPYRRDTRSNSRGRGICSPPSASGRSQPTMPASSPTRGLAAASSAAT